MSDKPLLCKETFCKALRLLKEQDETNDKVSNALLELTGSHVDFGYENKWLQALRMVLAEAVNDKYEYIEWWLYEATDDFRVWESDGSREWILKEPEALYDYIVSECQK